MAKEPRLEPEFLKTLNGSSSETPKKQYFLIRVMRRDDQGKTIPCSCLNPTTGMPDPKCPLCFAVGLIFDERWIGGYGTNMMAQRSEHATRDQLPHGQQQDEPHAFYLQATQVVRSEDHLVEADVVENKVIRTRHWRVDQVTPFKLDEGWIDYIRVSCSRLLRRQP